MKKIASLLIVMGIIFSMVACDQKTDPPALSSEPEEMEFAEFQWPDTDIAKLMPVPKSTIGNINWSQDYGFVIYVAETSLDDYAAYVKECEALGFTLECRKGDDYFYADNADGYHVALNYQEGDVMFVRIDEPKDEPSKSGAEPPEEKPSDTSAEQPVENPPEKPVDTMPSQEEPSSGDTSTPVEEPNEPKDDYSDSAHRSQAVQAFQNYGDYICPYGIEYHWFHQNISEYEGNGVWHFKVGVTITNQFDADREAVAEGRVSFIEEEVTEFEILDDWE